MPQLFADKLRHLRLQQQLTQRQLAEQLGLSSQSHISHLEAGRKAPLIDLILKIASQFGVRTDYLLDDRFPIDPPVRGMSPAMEDASYPKLFGAKLRHLRTKHGWNQTQLSLQLDLPTQAFISYLEAGHKQPSPDLVVRIAQLFEVSTDYLLQDELPIEQSSADLI